MLEITHITLDELLLCAAYSSSYLSQITFEGKKITPCNSRTSTNTSVMQPMILHLSQDIISTVKYFSHYR